MVIDSIIMNAETTALRTLRLDLLEYFVILKASDKAESCCDACRNEAQEQADTVNNRQPLHAHLGAYGQRRDCRAAFNRAVVAFPRHQHEYRENKCNGVHDE